MRIYWLDSFETGNLGLMPRPRGNEWLEDEVYKLKLNKVNTVISLLEADETRELEIEREPHFCKLSNIDFLHFPIEDRKVPTDSKSFLKLINQVNQKLECGENIVVHCRMGIGRTSLIAASVLISRGYSAQEAFDFISKKRTLTVPDTVDQVTWLKGIEGNLKDKSLPSV